MTMINSNDIQPPVAGRNNIMVGGVPGATPEQSLVRLMPVQAGMLIMCNSNHLIMTEQLELIP
jgi:hypothetical protein